MDKKYIEREVEQRSEGLKKFAGIWCIIISICIFIFVREIPFYFPLIILIIGLIAIIIPVSNKVKQDYKYKIIREEELREAQLQALKKGKKEVHITGKMSKLR